MPVADTIAARITEVSQAVEGEEPTPEAEETTEAVATLEAAVAPEDEEKAAKRALIEAKLAEARDRRAAANQGKKARAEREAAAEDRKAAAEEKAKWDAIGKGSYRDGLLALGKDPRVEWEKMNREAIEAGTPEAQQKALEEKIERRLAEIEAQKLAPLQQTIEELKAREQSLAAQAHEGQLLSAFQTELKDPSYIGLRTEYDDADLIGYVKHFDKNPQAFYEAAKHYSVSLTDPGRGFTMREILTVLKSAQDAHDQGRQQRASKLAPAASSAKTPTVNGTAPRGNAGTTIGNDLAGERAAPSRRLTRLERINAEIERQEKR